MKMNKIKMLNLVFAFLFALLLLLTSCSRTMTVELAQGESKDVQRENMRALSITVLEIKEYEGENIVLLKLEETTKLWLSEGVGITKDNITIRTRLIKENSVILDIEK